jgi:FMN phosphatase YigB (HAD superfamily)
MRCFFDVDGVMLDFESSYLRAIREYFQLEIPYDYQTSSWDFSEVLTEQQQMEGWEYFINSDYFRQLEGLIAAEQFNAVFGAYPVHFVTNIPPTYLEARRENLRNLGYDFESLHSGGFLSFDEQPPRTKSMVIADMIIPQEKVLFVDDHPKNCVDVQDRFPEADVWLMSRPFNRDFSHPTIQRAEHWDQIVAALPTTK